MDWYLPLCCFVQHLRLVSNIHYQYLNLFMLHNMHFCWAFLHSNTEQLYVVWLMRFFSRYYTLLCYVQVNASQEEKRLLNTLVHTWLHFSGMEDMSAEAFWSPVSGSWVQRTAFRTGNISTLVICPTALQCKVEMISAANISQFQSLQSQKKGTKSVTGVVSFQKISKCAIEVPLRHKHAPFSEYGTKVFHFKKV